MMTARGRRRSRSANTLLFLLIAGLLQSLSGCSESVSLDQIRDMHEKGRYEESVEALRVFLAERPDDPELNYLYGVALLQTGSPDMAIWSMRKAAQSPEWAQRAGLALGRAALASQEWENAFEIANDLLKAKPDDADALAIRANARLEQRKDYESVLADFERVIELRPEDLESRASRVATLIALGRVEEAADGIAELETSAGSDDVPEAQRAQICTVRALFAAERGLQDEAAEHFASCLSRFPRSGIVIDEYVAYLDEQRRPKEANEVLASALEANPNDSMLRLTLARRLDATGSFDEAEAVLREGIALPNRRAASDAWAGLADHHVAMHDMGAAADAYQKSLEEVEEPTPFQVLSLADILARAGRNEQALEIAEGLENDAYRGLIEARVHLNRDEPGEALARLDEVLPLWPNNPGARYWAARAAEQIGDFPRAVEEYRQSIRSAPGFSDAGLRLGRLHAADWAIDDGWAAINRYLEEHPDSAEGAALSMRLASLEADEERMRKVVTALRRRPTWPSAVAERADQIAATSGPRAAVEAIRTGSGLDLTRPASAPALRALVTQLAALEQEAEALAAVDAALAKFPRRSELVEIRATLLASSGRDEEARLGFDRALELDARNARAWLGLGRLRARAGETEAALDALERASVIDESLRESYVEAAQLLAAAGRSAEAEERWGTLLKAHPYDTAAAMALARARLERGEQDDRTLELALRAVRFRGGVEASRLVADVHLARGDDVRARRILERIEAEASQG